MTVTVVIPARDEEELIGRCLASVTRAALPCNARIILVADRCTDDTVAIARTFAGVEVVEIDAAVVGIARATGFALATSDWIATTDADTIVPAHWLIEQLELARAGADVVVGTVRPGPDDLTTAEWSLWHESHADGRALGHVHGANLGMRASAYRAVGGFTDVAEHEDVDLVHRLRSGGFRISAGDTFEVVTSGRREGRTPGGYARYLRENLRATVPELALHPTKGI
jgi:glycosyltransferase involved in cell wall biosynthesis